MTHEQMIKQVQRDTQKWLITGFGGAVVLNKEQLEEKYKLIRKLLIEEYNEYLDAVRSSDRLEQLNAISDLLFVVNNLPYFEGKHNVEDWKVIPYVLRFCSHEYIFEHEYRSYYSWMKAINTIIEESGFSYYEIYKENEATFKSNMTKYCKTEEEAKLSVEMYMNGTHPNKLGIVIECDYFSTGFHDYPFRVQSLDGKILKSHLFLDVENFR